MHVYGELSGKLTSAGLLHGTLVGDHHKIEGMLTIPSAVGVDVYTGPYEFTPTQQTQTIDISYKTATADIVINPIPFNYGLITYNGSIITVS